jgi:N-acetylglucosaminyl-diphospho-decaprenol L-rhamnosyltransferase
MAITAVVVNYNTRTLLERCLKSLSGWEEVVVVDNASTDGSASMVSEAYPSVKLVRNRENVGFGAGANAGIVQATGDLVLVLNPDTWVTPDVAPTLEKFFLDHPRAGIAGCGLLDDEGRMLVSARRFYTLESLVARRVAPGSSAVREFEMLESGHDVPRRADWVAGTGMALRKELFDSVGGFDERFFLYFEDVDICLRAWISGSEVWYVPSARIYHDEQRASSRSYKALGQHMRSWATFNLKWKGVASPRFAPSDATPHPLEKPRIRAVIESRALVGHLTGVGRSLESLVVHMADRDDIELVLLVTSARRSRDIHKYRFYAKTRSIPVPARLVDSAWRRTKLLPVEALTGACDVVHGPNFVVPPSIGAARVLTVHDLGFVRHPELHTPSQRRLAETARVAIESSHRIIAVSEFTKSEICSVFGTDPQKIDVIYHGVRELPQDGPPLPVGFPKQFLLFAGTFELRKGADILLSSYRIAREKDPGIPPLVIAGELGLGGEEVLETAFRSGLERTAVKLIRRAPDTTLAHLYRNATMFVFPSIYEGFGMPPVEAMAHGVPTVATSLSALEEILGDGAHLVDVTYDPSRKDEMADAFAQAILDVLYDDDLRRTLARRGKARARQFSWTRAADLVVASYRRAIADSTGA